MRPVRIAYGDGIAFVLPETAAQVVCQGLSAAQWREIVGGEVGRWVDASAASGTCVVVSGWLRIELSMTDSAINSIHAQDETIAGHRARVDVYSNELVTAAAVVVPIGEQNLSAHQHVNAEPVLHVQARMDGAETHSDLNGLVHRLLAALLPTLTHDGPATPVYDATRRLAYTSTEPIPGAALVDQPRTVHSLMLCTAVLKTLRRTPRPEQISVNSVGECNVEGPVRVFAAVNRFGGPSSGEFTIAGYPAHPVEHGVEIELLKMTTDSGRTDWVELELTRRDLDPTQLRTWAEQVATPLLTT